MYTINVCTYTYGNDKGFAVVVNLNYVTGTYVSF